MRVRETSHSLAVESMKVSKIFSLSSHTFATIMVRLQQSWSSESASSTRTKMEIGAWVYCIGGVHKGLSGYVTKKHPVMISFRSGDNAIRRCMRYNLYVLPSPSEDAENDIEAGGSRDSDSNIRVPSKFLVTVLKRVLEDLADDGLCDEACWRTCCKAAEESAFSIFA